MSGVATSLRAFAAERKGSVAVIVAGGSAMILACSAIAVDLGSIYAQSRKLQGIADLAAIAAARDLNDAQDAARATVLTNGWNGAVDSDVQTGAYDASPSKAVKDRFTAGAASPNAARVELTAEADLFFGRAIMGGPSVTIRRSATAARAEFTSFSIGTRLASLNGGIANSLLSALAGGSVSLTVADYNALATARVDLFEYTSALRTSAGLQAATFNETLAHDVTVAQALTVLGNLLIADGQATAGAAIKKIATAAGGLGLADLDSLFDLGPAGAQDRIIASGRTAISLSAMDLADAMLLVASENRQVQLDLGAQVPGVTDVDLWLGIGERPNNSPWLTLDDDGGVVIRTNQARLYLKASVLSVLGILGLKPITLPVYVELASGEAKLAAISCPASPNGNKVTLDVKPSLGRVAIGDINTAQINNFTQALTVSPGVIADLALIKAHGTANVQLGGGGNAWKKVHFSNSEIEAHTIKTVQTNDIAQASLTSLLSNTQVTVTVAGIPSAPLGLSVLASLKTLGSPLDGVINTLTDVLGVGLGEADVQVHGLRCRDAALVS